METQIHKIIYLDKEEKITQFLLESDEQYKDRIEFIRKLEKENINWKECIKLSKIYYNVKYRKCKYIPYIYNKIKKYL
jgi:hypothetical protein